MIPWIPFQILTRSFPNLYSHILRHSIIFRCTSLFSCIVSRWGILWSWLLVGCLSCEEISWVLILETVAHCTTPSALSDQHQSIVYKKMMMMMILLSFIISSHWLTIVEQWTYLRSVHRATLDILQPFVFFVCIYGSSVHSILLTYIFNFFFFASLHTVEKGSTVTFLLRNPNQFDSDSDIAPHISSGKARIVQGDATKEDDVRQAWSTASQGQDGANTLIDAVLFTVG